MGQQPPGLPPSPVLPVPIPVPVPAPNLWAELAKDLWVHIGGLVAIAFGALDIWYFHGLSHDTDLIILAAGFLAQGVKIVNGAATLAAASATGAAIATSATLSAQRTLAAATQPPAPPSSSAPPAAGPAGGPGR